MFYVYFASSKCQRHQFPFNFHFSLGVSKIFKNVFLKKSLMLKKAAFIWSKIQQKQYCEILLEFKIADYYFIIFQNVIYFCDGKAELLATIMPSVLLICCVTNIHFFIIINVKTSCVV